MNIISHLIYLSRPNLDLQEDKKCQKWTGIDLISLLNHPVKNIHAIIMIIFDYRLNSLIFRPKIKFFRNNSIKIN